MIVSDTKKNKKERNKLHLTLTLDDNTPAKSGNDNIDRANSKFFMVQTSKRKPYWKPPSAQSSVKEYYTVSSSTEFTLY